MSDSFELEKGYTTTFVMRCEAASHMLWISLWFLNVSFSFPTAQRWHSLIRQSVCWLLNPTSSMISAISNSSRDLNGLQGWPSGGGTRKSVARCSKLSKLYTLASMPLLGWYSILMSSWLKVGTAASTSGSLSAEGPVLNRVHGPSVSEINENN